MSVFTVFFCGTGSNKFDTLNKSYWDGELVSKLASQMATYEFADWVVIDGPGSGNLQADELFTAPGGYGWTGTVFGSGWEENVQHAVNIIKGHTTWQRKALTQQEYERLKKNGIPINDVEVTGSWLWRTYNYGTRKVTPQALQEQIIKIRRKGQPIPDTVNIVGWSRGGISCHMLANAMLSDPALKHIKVNIFAIDPVPGAFNIQKHRVTLGANVKEYVAFYARDERSKGFACVIPQTSPGTAVRVYPMLGRHATLVGNAAVDGANGKRAFIEPGLIVRHYAEKCLSRWGAKLNNMLNLSNAKIDEHLRFLNGNHDAFTAMRKHSYTVITEQNGNDRFVHWGERSLKFSLVGGLSLKPDAGLAAPVASKATDYKDI